MNEQTKKDTLAGISCDAKNCVHHTEGDLCNAHGIKVGYYDACTTGETACKTFAPKA